MKRTDRLSKFIAILLFLAFVAYAAVYAVRTMQDRIFCASSVTSFTEKSPRQLEQEPHRSGASSPKYRRR